MKQKDIAIIIIVVAISGVISSFVSSKIFTPPKIRQQQVEVVPPLKPDLPPTDPAYFYNGALDPTYQIQIGPTTNPSPFSGAQ